jgi:hypothetical protein
MLDLTPTWLIAVALAILIGICGEIGFHIGARAKASLGESPFAVLQAAVFGLLALLLAFSFSAALSRYDARRGEVVREAKAIGSTILRAQLLGAPTAALMHSYLQRYLDARIAFAAAGIDERARTEAARRSVALQTRMWRLAVAQATSRDRSPMVQLFFIQALNDAIDQSQEQDALSTAHVPDSIVIVVIVVIAFASVLLGIGFGRTERRSILAITFFAIVISLIVATILDLDRPQRGFIRVSLEPLQALRITLIEPSKLNVTP